jgi:hypothetical protein
MLQDRLVEMIKVGALAAVYIVVARLGLMLDAGRSSGLRPESRWRSSSISAFACGRASPSAHSSRTS